VALTHFPVWYLPKPVIEPRFPKARTLVVGTGPTSGSCPVEVPVGSLLVPLSLIPEQQNLYAHFSHFGKHPFSQDVVCSRLIPLTGLLEPGDNIRVQTQRNGLFYRPIKSGPERRLSRRWAEALGHLLVTQTLSDRSEHHSCRHHPRGSVRRVLTGNSETKPVKTRAGDLNEAEISRGDDS
jgi:hypothetical protein